MEEKKQGSNKIYVFTAIIVIILLLTVSCSIKKMAMNQVADALTSQGSSNVFTSDNDPELVGDALPFTIKMYESLMMSIPWHQGLKLQTGSLYIMYANAFLQTPADMLPDEELLRQEFLLKRAKNLYLRGRDIILQAIEKQHPGFIKNLEAKKYDLALKDMTQEDVPFLYWTAAGWLGAYALDPFDMGLGITMPHPREIMNKVYSLAPNFRDGAVHDFYVLYYGSLPDYMGGDFQKARYHYQKALEASKGIATSPHLSLATTISVKEQNLKEFKELLNKVLAVNPDSDPDNRLVHIINQRKAEWLLQHADNFILEAENGTLNEGDEPEPETDKNVQGEENQPQSLQSLEEIE